MTAPSGSPLRLDGSGAVLAVRLSPRASRERIEGICIDANGEAALKVAVGAPPEDGKANAALLRLLAKEWKLAKSDIAIVQGATDRRKLLRITGDIAPVQRCLDHWRNQQS